MTTATLLKNLHHHHRHNHHPRCNEKSHRTIHCHFKHQRLGCKAKAQTLLQTRCIELRQLQQQQHLVVVVVVMVVVVKQGETLPQQRLWSKTRVLLDVVVVVMRSRRCSFRRPKSCITDTESPNRFS